MIELRVGAAVAGRKAGNPDLACRAARSTRNVRDADLRRRAGGEDFAGACLVQRLAPERGDGDQVVEATGISLCVLRIQRGQLIVEREYPHRAAFDADVDGPGQRRRKIGGCREPWLRHGHVDRHLRVGPPVAQDGVLRRRGDRQGAREGPPRSAA